MGRLGGGRAGARVRYGEVKAARPEPDVVREAVAMLRSGGLLAHPTATVYGIGGPPREEVDALIARLKGRRAAGKPLIRLAADVETARAAHPKARWDETAERLAAAFWPGPLTLVLDDGTPAGFAVRVEPHPVVRAVLAAWGGLMSSTSLNRSGEPAATTTTAARRVLEAFGESPRPVLLLAAGRLRGSSPSTLLSLREGEPRLLREGAVPRARLRTVLEALA